MAKMQFSIFIAVAFVVLSASTNAQCPPAPMLPPTPAAPAPHHVNLTELLSVAGRRHDLRPKDDAFKAQKNPPLSNLTKDQLKQLLLSHALPHYYSLSEFKNLSQSGPVSTFAGGQYPLKFTDVSGTVRIETLWTRTKVSSSVFSTDPVAVYQVNRVLLPEAIFGTDVPPMPAPAPAPVVSSPSDSPSADSDEANASSPKSSHKNSAQTLALLQSLWWFPVWWHCSCVEQEGWICFVG
ncbi:hypothetical protein Bca52824_040659 [Brassica carinata]|uniref:FAS1 domain-containing protein n=1 Tax=Brassica carinata TaxID=52824 RepID=A0A8X7RTG6_BRACI|nr:hypothetical protein Bca52824_040659 [Brassica carinata]